MSEGRSWLGLIELAVVFSFAIGWAVVEWVANRAGRRRDAASGKAAEPEPIGKQSDPAKDSRESP